MSIKVKEIKDNAFIDEFDVEHQIPNGCIDMTKEELQYHIDIANDCITKFIEENEYGTVDVI